MGFIPWVAGEPLNRHGGCSAGVRHGRPADAGSSLVQLRHGGGVRPVGHLEGAVSPRVSTKQTLASFCWRPRVSGSIYVPLLFVNFQESVLSARIPSVLARGIDAIIHESTAQAWTGLDNTAAT